MSDVIQLGALTGTVSFSRKVSDNNYGGSDAFWAIQFPIENGDLEDLEKLAQKASTLYGVCKAVVNAQLGLPVEDERAAALLQSAFGPGIQTLAVNPSPTADNVVPINTPAAQVAEAVAPQAPTVGPNPPHGGDYRSWSKAQKDENTAWAKARLATNPEEFYDNRADKKNPSAPDFKSKVGGIGIWL